MRQFAKPPLAVEEQLQLLKQRGLKVRDDDRACQLLQVVTMFRLCPYMRPFQVVNDDNHGFKEGASLADIVAVYRFDGALRQVIMDALERVEVAIRASISNHMCCSYSSAHWYLSKGHFQDRYDYDGLIGEVQGKRDKELAAFDRDCKYIQRSRADDEQKRARIESRMRDNYARFYGANYDTPELPPSWAMFEDLSMGAVSKLYQGLAKDSDRKRIAHLFQVPWEVLGSWMHTLTFVRNICAHHGRLWNRELSVPPKLPKGWPLPYVEPHQPRPNRRLYIVATMLAHLMPLISPDTRWRERFVSLIEGEPNTPLLAMGFPSVWRDQPQWAGVKASGDRCGAS